MPKIDFLQPEHLLEVFPKKFDRTVKSVGAQVLPFFGASNIEESGPEKTIEKLEDVTMPYLKVQLNKAQLIVLSAGSGTGKSAVGKGLETYGIQKLKRTTTRPRRPNEQPHDYHFVSPDEFEEMNAQGHFVHVKPTYGELRGILYSQLCFAMCNEGIMFAEGDALTYSEIIKWYEEFKDLRYVGIYLLPPSSQQYSKQISEAAAQHFSLYKLSQRLDRSLDYLSRSAAHIIDGTYHGYMVNHDPLTTARKILDMINPALLF